MNLRPCKIEEIGCWYSKTKNQKLFEEFVNSDFDCVEVENYNHKNAKSAQTCLHNSAKHFGFTNIHVVVRGEKVYLVKG